MLQEEDNHSIKRFTFVKAERICSRKTIKDLIEQNKTIFAYPFKCYYSISADNSELSCNQIVVTVSKRLFKRAVVRNLIKRRTKEVYRLNKNEIFNEKQSNNVKNFQLIIVYISKEILSYPEIEKGMIQLLKLISHKMGS
jgi:ribonuclease P protein component